MRRGAWAAGAGVVVLLVLPAPAAWAANVCDTAPKAAEVFKGTPLEDLVYGPKRIAEFATGQGVRVAVIDSGVDAGHPQLRGHVDDGKDFLHKDTDSKQDCVGHGTGVASVIAAQPVGETGFQGLAPGVTIVPVRISEQQEIDGKAVGDRGSPAQFAQAINWAVDEGRAQVINLSLVMTDPNDQVAAAVKRAHDKGVVVVAAVGNHAKEGNPTPYPADDDGVIGVGAVDSSGELADFSQHGDYVDLVAYGKPVTVAARGQGHENQQGTSFSAPFVSATAALLLQKFPGLSPDQVLRRMQATADPAPGGSRSDEYGAGLLNPYRALTETLGPGVHESVAPVVMSPNDPAAEALAARRAKAQDAALLFAGIGGGLVLLIGIAAVIIRQGRRRGWRPAGPDAP
ncbi:type VII secretion-associated serine protease mycosin [Paractinoplanes durhamensis]|uniref:type VII secretion-associated serine protease mycosin n=1 Tax=Paractinoplanes durhamensis TaxID=113563 RepID=UPI0019441D39|nr:type VII secretion-associated serine protease mycosin [Actinoplanes durhamensis]